MRSFSVLFLLLLGSSLSGETQYLISESDLIKLRMNLNLQISLLSAAELELSNLSESLRLSELKLGTLETDLKASIKDLEKSQTSLGIVSKSLKDLKESQVLWISLGVVGGIGVGYFLAKCF